MFGICIVESKSNKSIRSFISASKMPNVQAVQLTVSSQHNKHSKNVPFFCGICASSPLAQPYSAIYRTHRPTIIPLHLLVLEPYPIHSPPSAHFQPYSSTAPAQLLLQSSITRIPACPHTSTVICPVTHRNPNSYLPTCCCSTCLAPDRSSSSSSWSRTCHYY